MRQTRLDFGKRNIWDNWKGARATDYKGEIWIATNDDEWKMRLATWKSAYREGNGKTSCPCPLPEGHIMFN